EADGAGVGGARAPARVLVVDPADAGRAGEAAEVAVGELQGAVVQGRVPRTAPHIAGLEPVQHPVDPPLFFGAGERGWHEDDRLVPVAVGGDRPPPAGTSAYLDFCVLRHKATLSHRCDTPQGPISLFGDGPVHFRAALGRAPAPLPLRCGPELVSRCARPPRAPRRPVTAGGRIRPPA